DADHLSLSRPVSPVGAAALGGPPPVLARPRARTRRMTASNPSARRKPGPVVVRGSRASGMVRRRRRSRTDALSRRWIPTFAGMTIMAFAGACTIGPNYQRPATPVPVAYKEAALKEGWQVAHPADIYERGTWWSVYDDPVLDGLERQIDISNQNLKAAEANFRQAEAIVAEARASFFPTATINAQAQRQRTSGGRVGSTGVSGGNTGNISNFFSVSTAASWVPDLWDKVGRTVESNVASAQASAANVASARLAAQGQLASDYIQLRIADELKRLLDAAVAAYTESLRIVQNQYNAGIVSASD